MCGYAAKADEGEDGGVRPRHQGPSEQGRQFRFRKYWLLYAEIMLFVLLFFVGLGANKVIRRQRIKLQQAASHPHVATPEQTVEEVVYEQTKIVYFPDSGEYEIVITPPPKLGETKDFSIRITEGNVAQITQVPPTPRIM